MQPACCISPMDPKSPSHRVGATGAAAAGPSDSFASYQERGAVDLSVSAIALNDPPAPTAATSAASPEKEVFKAPRAARRMLPLQTLEAIYARLPHYESPADIPAHGSRFADPAPPSFNTRPADHSFADDAAARPAVAGAQIAPTDRIKNLSSAKLLGARLAAKGVDVVASGGDVSAHTPAGRSTPSLSTAADEAAAAEASSARQQRGASAFEVVGTGDPPPAIASSDAGWARRRYSAPHNLVFHLKRAYLDEPTIVKGRTRYDRCVVVQCLLLCERKQT